MYEYPHELTEYLTEQESEGSEIFTTQSEDGTIWIIKPNGLEKWYILIAWNAGSRTFNLVNLSGKSVSRMKAIFIEDRV